MGRPPTPTKLKLLRGENAPGQTIMASADGEQMKFTTEVAAAAA